LRAKIPVIISARDASGHLHADVPIKIRDLITNEAKNLFTGAKGSVSVSLAPGRYRVDAVAGCAPRAEVFKGEGGTLGVAVSESPTRLSLKVEARRRFWPGTPITWRPEAPWPHGATVSYRFSMFDRCSNKLAPNTSFEELIYRPNNLKLILQEPKRSDAESYATVTFSCMRAGDAALVLADPNVPSDSVNLFSLKPPFDASAKWCR